MYKKKSESIRTEVRQRITGYRIHNKSGPNWEKFYQLLIICDNL